MSTTCSPSPVAPSGGGPKRMSTADSRAPSSGGRNRENHSGGVELTRSASSRSHGGQGTSPARDVAEGSIEPERPAYAMPLTAGATCAPSLEGQLELEQPLGAPWVGLADAIAGTPAGHGTRATRRLLGVARATSMEDDDVAEHRPVLAHEEPPDLVLDLDGVLLLRPPEAAHEPAEVRVDGDARNVEGVPEHDVRRLATHTGQRDEVLQPRRHLAVEVLEERRA